MNTRRGMPKVITLRLTSRCNANCKPCFAPKNIPEMPLSLLRKLFDFLVENGITAILLTGGEPLLREDFAEVVGELKRRGFKIFLDTNADFFSKHRRIIARCVDVIGLPVDFADKSYRGSENLNNVLRTLECLAKAKKRPKIRIGTVVTKDNFEDLVKIGNLIKKYPISVWKLYQFTPQESNAIRNKRFLEITEDQFDLAVKQVKSKFSRFFGVVISKRTDRNRAYFYIESDGRVVMPVDDMNICKLVSIGNVFDKDIFDKWASWVSRKSHIANAKATFMRKFR